MRSPPPSKKRSWNPGNAAQAVSILFTDESPKRHAIISLHLFAN
ncbi:MAG TPA: hypothetical protein VHD63_27305 [Ktedonobacteraceae bacterium]|nr:hypothetical protein [Ktedonobacteraceae bacterium]